MKRRKVVIQPNPEEYKSLANQILNLANRGIPKFDFFKDILEKLLHFSNSDGIELWLREEDEFNLHFIHQDTKYIFQVLPSKKDGSDLVPLMNGKLKIDQIRMDILKETSKYPAMIIIPDSKEAKVDFKFNDGYKSYIFFTLFFGEKKIGLLELMSLDKNHFNLEEAKLYESLAHDLGVAIVNQRIQAALRERVKELSCLYKIAQIAENPKIEFSDALQKITEHIQPAWQYPEITHSRIILDGKEYATKGFKEHIQKQVADIYIKGNRRGALEVVYTEEKPEVYEGPFLREERNLIDTLAAQIALLIERRQSERYRLELQAQLRHADRLATIGQLAAGVAHELNEPLGNILGFAQLIKKCPALPDVADQDADKIIDATLNAREVIKKLLLFARQMPPKKDKINLNQSISNGLYFFEARCAKEGIELVRLPLPNLPEIIGDQAQLNQVIVNLVVNAIQAMPSGGKLTIKTEAKNGCVNLVVEDTGIGMSKEIVEKIFDPFFTTKDINEGTGLGLAVVHGIVTSHQGRIKVSSIVDKGTKFEIKLPIPKPNLLRSNV